MRFIMIETDYNGSIAVNTSSIVSVQRAGEFVSLYMSGGSGITTKFTDVQSAVDYIQRAPSVSMGVRRYTVDGVGAHRQ